MDSDGFCEESGGHSSTNIVPISERAFQDMHIMFNGIGRDLFINTSGPSVRIVRKNLYDNPTYVLVEDKKEGKSKTDISENKK